MYMYTRTFSRHYATQPLMKMTANSAKITGFMVNDRVVEIQLTGIIQIHALPTVMKSLASIFTS